MERTPARWQAAQHQLTPQLRRDTRAGTSPSLARDDEAPDCSPLATEDGRAGHSERRRRFPPVDHPPRLAHDAGMLTVDVRLGARLGPGRRRVTIPAGA